MKLYNSKKATVTAAGVGLIPALVALVSVILSIVIPEGTPQKAELIASIAEVLAIGLALLLAAYNVGQGLADFGKERNYTILDQLTGNIEAVE